MDFLTSGTFRYRISLLNLFAGIYLAGISVYTILNYAELSKGEGWGVVAMVGLSLFGLGALALNFVAQVIFRNNRNLLIADLVILAGFAIFITWMELTH
jgi:hypothetical protein